MSELARPNWVLAMRHHWPGVTDWLRQARDFPHPSRLASSAMAMLYLVGGCTVLLAVVLPHSSALNTVVLVTIGLSSPIAGLVIYLLRDQLSIVVLQWFLAAGTGIITTLVAFGESDSVSVTFSFFYMWIVAYSLLFFSRLGTIIQIGFALLVYASVLFWQSTAGHSGLSAEVPLVLVAVISTTGVLIGLLMRARDQGRTDPLTGVANRRGLDQYLDDAVQDSRVKHNELVIAMIDIDHFKTFNDRSGHAAGDQLLKDLTAAWRPVLRAEDRIGRFGGDEFVVVLPSRSKHSATAILERLRAAAPNGVTCSVGAAQWQNHETVSMCLSNADGALYDAKRRGRNRLAWKTCEANGHRRAWPTGEQSFAQTSSGVERVFHSVAPDPGSALNLRSVQEATSDAERADRT